MTFTKLFGKMDSMGVYGFMPVWFLFFFVSFGVMIMDDSVGVSRDFCAVSQIICCFNLCAIHLRLKSHTEPMVAKKQIVNVR